MYRGTRGSGSLPPVASMPSGDTRARGGSDAANDDEWTASEHRHAPQESAAIRLVERLPRAADRSRRHRVLGILATMELNRRNNDPRKRYGDKAGSVEAPSKEHAASGTRTTAQGPKMNAGNAGRQKQNKQCPASPGSYLLPAGKVLCEAMQGVKEKVGNARKGSRNQCVWKSGRSRTNSASFPKHVLVAEEVPHAMRTTSDESKKETEGGMREGRAKLTNQPISDIFCVSPVIPSSPGGRQLG
ncbi:hypothetical protein C8F04DRAFT_1342525 [Mycena alexandri]|uniref:Uncharacterized protein n=1 Tax=Mycena alexandri TaxID=1745969 RepID=A0AAD6X825_9AGAR|nr:hypothetical protein C8F04DRAFT_1342525 [Mycena alexandri]